MQEREQDDEAANGATAPFFVPTGSPQAEADLDAIFFRIMADLSEVERAPIDRFGNAQQVAAALKVPCPFRDLHEIEAALEKLPENQQTVVRMALGLGGEIHWQTLHMPWTDPGQMPNRMGQYLLWIASDAESYRSETLPPCRIKRHPCDPKALGKGVVEFRKMLEDPTSPIVLRIAFRAETTVRDRPHVLEIEKNLRENRYFEGPRDVQQAGTKVELLLPTMDFSLSEWDPETFDYVMQFIHDLQKTGHVEKDGRGRPGSIRFTLTATLWAPEILNKGVSDHLPRIQHHARLRPQNPPELRHIAGFLHLTLDQVRQGVRGFFVGAVAHRT